METTETIAPAKEVKAVKATTKKATTPAPAAKKTTKTAAPKQSELKAKVTELVEDVKDVEEIVVEGAKKQTATAKSKLMKAVETTKAANKIMVEAGTEIFKTAVKTTKSIAKLYKKAGEEALGLGKDVFDETKKIATDNQKKVVSTSVKAFKDTVETIRESNIIEIPKKKSKKK